MKLFVFLQNFSNPENLNEFKNHIKKYHTVDGVGDNSLHIEGGRFFTISKTFYEN